MAGVVTLWQRGTVTVSEHSQYVSVAQHPGQVVKAAGGGGIALEAYPGPYDVRPSVNSQVLPTERRRMTTDMTIEAIPFASVSNEAGGRTVTIGDPDDWN